MTARMPSGSPASSMSTSVGTRLRTTAVGPVIVNAHCNFRRQIKYPASILVQMGAGHLGRTSVETTYVIRDAADEQIIYADGAAKIVWVDFKKEKSTALPEKLRQLLTSL